MSYDSKIQTNAKGKPTSILHEDVEYVCIPRSQFDRLANDFIQTLDKSTESAIRTSFVSGYRFALERLGLHYFNVEIPEVPKFTHEHHVRKKIKIGNNSYYEDEVLERLNALPSTESIWRK